MLAGQAAWAQDIEPRSYANLPVGLNVALAGAVRSTGGLATDPTVPLNDAHLRIDGALLAYLRALNLWGDAARFDIILPYARLRGTATLAGQPLERHIDGLGDARVRGAINFYGAPALSPREFAAYRQDFVAGGSVQLTVPTGQYDDTRVINLGSHRWAVKTELGMSKAIGDWFVDLAAAVNLYGRNNDYLGQTRQQAPIQAVQTSVTRNFAGGAWAALGYTYYRGGRTTVNGVQRDDEIGNSRAGIVVAIPVDRANIIKLAASRGLSIRTGTDFDTVGVFWQHAWLGAPD
ncbi:MAG TPA: transporter [Caldimonas sp.]|nr:transporter [Caldimonas sp.]